MIKTITTTRYVDDETQQEYILEPVEETISIEKTRDGYKLKYLTQDEQPMSPDEDTDDSVFLVHYHRSFQVKNELCNKSMLGYIYTGNDVEYDKDGAKELLKKYHCFAVDAYMHSGVSLKLSGGFSGRLPQGHERFDVSSVGAVLVKKAEFGAGGVEFEHTRDEAETIAQDLLKTWNQYLSGDVYCCVIEKLNKNKEQINYDVCGGFYGFDYAKECLKEGF